jgi:hypothetical protein
MFFVRGRCGIALVTHLDEGLEARGASKVRRERTLRRSRESHDVVRYSKISAPMSALGQKRTFRVA